MRDSDFYMPLLWSFILVFCTFLVRLRSDGTENKDNNYDADVAILLCL